MPVQILGKRFRQTVGQRLGHDALVVVVLLLELGAKRVDPDPCRDDERADVVQQAGLLGGHVRIWEMRS